MSTLVSLDEVREAAARIRPAARRTPLVDVPWPVDGQHSERLWLKCENLQPMGAFKIRGAVNMLAQLTGEQRSRGVITYSSGNHGQALALAARDMGVRAVVVMPTTAPAIKIDGARAYGAEVTLHGTTSAERRTRAEALAAEQGLTIVPPFDHPWIIAGQGTAGLEIVEQAGTLDSVFLPVGGGGLLAGVAVAVRALAPDARVVGVEPEGAAKMQRALEAGEPVALAETRSIADGLLPVRAGDLTFAHVRELVHEVVTVPEEAIASAVGWLSREARLVVEPSGAITTAAVSLGLGGANPARGRVVAVVSGGNVAPEQFARYVVQA